MDQYVFLGARQDVFPVVYVAGHHFGHMLHKKKYQNYLSCFLFRQKGKRNRNTRYNILFKAFTFLFYWTCKTVEIEFVLYHSQRITLNKNISNNNKKENGSYCFGSLYLETDQ